jgi:hypothetical protein
MMIVNLEFISLERQFIDGTKLKEKTHEINQI